MGLFAKKKPSRPTESPAAKAPRPAPKIQDTNAWHAAQNKAQRDIAAGWPGPCKNPQRRHAAELDLEEFLRVYFPLAFRSPFCADHKKMVQRIQEAATGGGLYARALFRGGGKTTIFARAMLWAALFGFRRFGVVVAATARDSFRIMRQQKDELWFNELLLADFPEICYPFARTLQRRPPGTPADLGRASRQTSSGHRTRWPLPTSRTPRSAAPRL